MTPYSKLIVRNNPPLPLQVCADDHGLQQRQQQRQKQQRGYTNRLWCALCMFACVIGCVFCTLSSSCATTRHFHCRCAAHTATRHAAATVCSVHHVHSSV
jgi:hypothetical protein